MSKPRPYGETDVTTPPVYTQFDSLCCCLAALPCCTCGEEMGGRTSAPEDRIKTVYLAVNGRDVSVSQQCSVVARSVCLRSLLSRPPSEEHF